MIPKITQTSWYDFGIEPVSIIKDVKSIEKRAGAAPLLKYAKTKGQEDLHIIALGAYEGTGFNRNLDCFRDYWCEKNAHYFQDADRAVHRHHKNKPSDPKFGNIKAAAYNKPMKRIELIVGLDLDKCADILHEQDTKGVTNWSMASKQAHDICTWCKHEAKTDADRCAHIPDKLGEINKQGEMCGMDNPDPRWFEVSYVRRGADRIGLSLQKVADSKVTPLLPRDYLNLFPDFAVPTEGLISKAAAQKRKLLSKLADIEKHIEALAETNKKNTLKTVNTEKLGESKLDELRALDPQRVFKVAADAGIIFSPDNFFKFVFGDRIKQAAIEEIKTQLPGLFKAAAEDVQLLHDELFDIRPLVNLSLEKAAMAGLNVSHSLFTPFVNSRIIASLENAQLVKKAAASDIPAQELAKKYLSYKLAALAYLDSQDKLDETVLFNAVTQNWIC